ncbi:MAG: TrmH family RNA methyltransferase [Nitrospirales bacterium]
MSQSPTTFLKSSSPANNKMTRITSRQNLHYKRWMSLRESKGMTRHQQCLVSGEKIIREMLTRHSSLCHELLYSPKTSHQHELPSHIKTFQLPVELFRTIDMTGASFPLLVCHTKDILSITLTTPPKGLEVLCPLGDPNNLGTVIRSCLAFGVNTLILLQEAAHPFHPKTIRASSGSVFNQCLAHGPSIQDLTRPEINTWITSLDMKGESLSTWQWSRNMRLLVGEEGLGIPQETFRHTLTIPQTQETDSLNAAIATSIALFSYRQQFPLSAR